MSVFVEILRCILCCSDETERDYWESNSLLTTSNHNSPVRNSSYLNSSVGNSSCTDHDLFRQRDPNKIYYYEYYPNVSTSEPTTKQSNAMSQQSEYGNKSSLKGNNEVFRSLESSRPPPPPSSAYYTSSSSSNKSQSLTEPSSFPKLASASSKPFLSPKGPAPSSSSSSSFSKPAIPSSKASLSLSNPALSALSQSLSSLKPPSFNSDQHQLTAKPPASPSTCKSPQSLSGSTLTKDTVPKVLKNPLSQKAPLSTQPTLSPIPPDSRSQQKKDSYLWVEKGASNYKIPKDIEDLIKIDIVPNVLKKPLSPSTYKDYFAALLYAEDFYYEKWSDFQLLNITLELREAAIYDKSLKNKHLKKSDKKDVKFFVAFEIDRVPGERPFLLSRDFVYAQCAGGISKKFQGILYRVVNSTTVLVEFEKEFYSRHQPNRRYDISFSFNRVCLKRAHQSIAAVSELLFQNYLFPDYASRKHIPSSETCFYSNWKLDFDGNSAVRQILSFRGQPPYLVEGPLCLTREKKELDDKVVFEYVLSKTGNVVQEAVLQICQRSPKSRILICTPSNRTCDVLMESLMKVKVIGESEMFRANAAFREVDGVSDEIFQVSLVEGECFSCPSLKELRQYRVISSTFVSSFRLHNQGITAGHFSHIFLVDASSAIEPETIIVLSNLANESTRVIVTGEPRDRPSRVRSDIARMNGLKMSYFERLRQTKAYRSCNPMFYTRLSTFTEEIR